VQAGTAVARFYFHYVSAHRYVNDDRGEELHSLAVAHLHALKLIVGTLRFMDPSDTERWTVQVADEAGKVLLTVLFPSVSRQPVPRDRTQFTQLGEDTPAVLRAYAAELRGLRKAERED